MKKAIAEKLDIDPRDGGYTDYLTRRIRRMVSGNDFEAIRNKQITMPLIIPMVLETSISSELTSRCMAISTSSQPQLIQVHDPLRYDPRTATLPSLTDTMAESGNLRYWLITNENMWAGQDHVADEVRELYTLLYDWFVQDKGEPGPSRPVKYGTDHNCCIGSLARAFQRRLILPEILEKPENSDAGPAGANRKRHGQRLPRREAVLFRPWALMRPSRVQRTYSPYQREMAKLDAAMESDADLDEDSFWRHGDEGTWDDEEGVPVWTD
ncbi:MAG: hypothetical protein L6R40_003955 [Gallowayella cf. fulva]|nr:MAG: hypothetical protein L6R40_003955 [Xanthomendoza cf. fulva]